MAMIKGFYNNDPLFRDKDRRRKARRNIRRGDGLPSDVVHAVDMTWDGPAASRIPMG